MVSFYDPLLIVLVFAYLYLAPFTKVEESFSIQAIHDIIHLGIGDLSQYDHNEFPGAVPRSFVGPLLVSGILKPLLCLFPPTASKLDGQLLARAILGLFNVWGISYLKNSLLAEIKKKKGTAKPSETKIKRNKNSKKVGCEVQPSNNGRFLSIWFVLFTMTQFHINFYASRTLPNFFALPFTNYAFGRIINGNYLAGISVLAFSSVVFRVELIALTLSTGLFLYLYKKVTIPQLIRAGLIGALIGAGLSLTVDSYFWGRTTVPEVESFFFNVIQGKSSEWGTHPFSLYFSKITLSVFLPLTVPILAIVGAWDDITNNRTLRIICLSSFLFVLLISFQPHKEWRFIVYVFPVINLAAANGASYVTSKASRSILYRILVLLVIGGTLISFVISVSWAQVSSYNYPGGFAVNSFHEKAIMQALRENRSKPVTVHFDVATAMTGATRFNELNDISGLRVSYDKTEDPSKLSMLWNSFDYLITEVDIREDQGATIPHSKNYGWKIIDIIEAYQGIDLKGLGTLNPQAVIRDLISKRNLEPIGKAIRPFVKLREAIYIYQRVDIEGEGNKSPF